MSSFSELVLESLSFLRQGILVAKKTVRKLVIEALLCVILHFKLNLKCLFKTSFSIFPLHFSREDLIPTPPPEIFDRCCNPHPTPFYFFTSVVSEFCGQREHADLLMSTENLFRHTVFQHGCGLLCFPVHFPLYLHVMFPWVNGGITIH